MKDRAVSSVARSVTGSSTFSRRLEGKSVHDGVSSIYRLQLRTSTELIVRHLRYLRTSMYVCTYSHVPAYLRTYVRTYLPTYIRRYDPSIGTCTFLRPDSENNETVIRSACFLSINRLPLISLDPRTCFIFL